MRIPRLVFVFTVLIAAVTGRAQTTLDASSRTVGPAASSYSLTATTSAAWTATSDQSWVTLSPASGEGTAHITFSVAELPDSTERTAKVTVGGAVHTITQVPGTMGRRFLQGVGLNQSGQLGIEPRYTTPHRMATGVISAAAGWRFSAFVKDDGTLWLTGANDDGQLGDGTRSVRTRPLQAASGVDQVMAGANHVLFLKGNDLWSMGKNHFGQLARLANDTTTPALAVSGVSAIATGGDQTLFIKTDGSLWAAGGDDIQLPYLPTGGTTTPIPLATAVRSACASKSHALLIKTDGTLWAVGRNYQGQLGNGTTIDQALPVQIATEVIAASAGDSHSVFLKSDGSLWTVGSNDRGELGDGTTTSRNLPRQIATGVASASAGAFCTFFITTDGSLWAVGANHDGRLGDGSTTDRLTPVKIASAVAQVSTNSFFGWENHSVFVKKDGSLWGFGSNRWGQLDALITNEAEHVTFIEADITAIAAGIGHTLMLRADGSLWGLGANDVGQLGNDRGSDTSRPTKISDDVVAIAAWDSTSYFIKRDSTLWAMGAPSIGGFGLGWAQTTPVQIAANVRQVSGGSPAYFVKHDDTLWSVSGKNPLASNVRTVTAGHNLALFSKTDGSLWGLGSGFGIANSTDAAVKIDTQATSFAVGLGYALYTKQDGSLWAFGSNRHGVFGDGTTTDRDRFTQVGTGIAAVTCYSDSYGNYHDVVFSESFSLFLKTDRSLWMSGTVPSSLPNPGLLSTRSTPLKIADDVVAMTAGSGFALFLQEYTFQLQPANKQVLPGSSFLLMSSANGTGVSYQWFKDGVALAGETASTLRRDNASSSDAGTYTVRASTQTSSATSDAATVTISASAAAVSRPAGLSIRTNIAAGQIVIPGLSVQGSGTKNVIIRAVGPGLDQYGVPGTMADPKLEVYQDSTRIAENDNWSSTLTTDFSRLGLFGLTTGSKDAAVATTLTAGKNYTVLVSGVGTSAGVVLIEIYDADSAPTARFGAVSVRGQSAPGADVLILGVSLQGTSPRPVLVRGIGPKLASFGVSGTLADPKITIFDANNVVKLINDQWGQSSFQSQLAAASNLVGVFPLDAGSKDAATLATLAPGNYTIQVSGADNGRGETLVELYEIP